MFDDGADEYKIIMLNKRYLSFRVIKVCNTVRISTLLSCAYRQVGLNECASRRKAPLKLVLGVKQYIKYI